MTPDADDVAAMSFVRLCRTQPDGSVRELVLSRAALHLHTFGVLTSVDSDRPGYVSDDYLHTLRTETSLPALELTLAGLWRRTVCGYEVTAEDTRAVVRRLRGDLDELAARCVAAGGHEHAEGSAQCCRCGVVSPAGPRAARGSAGRAD